MLQIREREGREGRTKQIDGMGENKDERKKVHVEEERAVKLTT